MKSYKVKHSSYTDLTAHKDDIIESFPRGVKCPVCNEGTFQLKLIDARTNGECSHCFTNVPYQFYDDRFVWLDNLQDKTK